MGGARRKHAGHAIDQVSKRFNDGYKEISKGSGVELGLKMTHIGK